MNSLQFTELQLRNWKNFTAVDVRLARRVFLGPNAAGKSNFLDALRLLRDLVTEEGGLARAVEVREGISKLRSLHARGTKNEVAISCRLRRPDASGWNYELGFKPERKGERPVVARERVTRIEPGQRNEVVLERPTETDRQDPEQLTQTALQQVTANQDFRELADFFRSITYLHMVPQLVREGQTPNARNIGEDQLGRDLLERMRATPARQQQARLRHQPDLEGHPKRTLVNLARKSRSRALRDDIVPEPGMSGVVGPGYTPCLTRFIEDHWDPLQAQQHSPSLRRALDALTRRLGT
jgi:hypothetical protein